MLSYFNNTLSAQQMVHGLFNSYIDLNSLSSFDKFLSNVDTTLIYHIEGKIPERGFSKKQCLDQK